MSTARPIYPNLRRVDLDAAAGQTVFDTAEYVPIWAIEDVAVWRRIAPATVWTRLTAGFSVALLVDGRARVTFAAAPRPGGGDPAVTIRLESRRLASRTTDVLRAGVVKSVPYEKELDVLTTTDQEQRRDIDDAQAADAALDARATALEGRATAVEGRATALEGRATTLEGRADGHDATLADHGGRIGALEGRADAVEPRVTALEGRASAVEGRASALESRATLIEWSAQALTARVDGHDDAIADLAAQFIGDPPSPAVLDLVAGGVAQRLAHPFTGQAAIIEQGPGTLWPAGLIEEALTSSHRLIRFDVLANRHDTADGARVDMHVSLDGGLTTSETRTIFSDATHTRSRAGAFRAMGSGRWGGIVTTGDTTRNTWFVYSDDAGLSWTQVDITASLTPVSPFVYGMMIAGDAPGEYIVAAYAGAATIKLLRTLDNGATWSATEPLTAAGLPGASPVPVEPSLARVPGVGWVMCIRVETTPASAQNMFVATSPDLVTWSSWRDSGVLLGSNPVHVVVEGARLYALVCLRSAFQGVGGNVCRSYVVDAAAFYAGSATLSQIAGDFVLPERAIGYAQSLRLASGKWATVIKCGEHGSTLRAATHALVLLRQGESLPTFQRATLADNVIDNPIPGLHFPDGETFTGSTAVRTAARWRSNPSGAVQTISRDALTTIEREAFPFRPTHGMRISNMGSPNDFAGVAQYWYGPDVPRLLRRLLRGSSILMRVYGCRGLPPSAGLTVTFAASGVAFATAALRRPAAGVTGPWRIEGRVPFTYAAMPDLAASASVSMTISCGASVAEYDFTLCGAFAYPGALGAEPEASAPDDTVARIARYMRVYSGTGRVVGQGQIKSASSARIIELHEMHAAPSILSWTGPIVVEGASADYAVSALTSASGTEQTAFTATIAGATVGAANLRLNDAAARIVLDTGY